MISAIASPSQAIISNPSNVHVGTLYNNDRRLLINSDDWSISK